MQISSKLLIFVIKASSVASSSTATSSPVPTGNVFTSYAKVSGSIFEINGERTYFAGTNSYWIGFLTDNSDVDLVMSNIASVSKLS